MTRHLSVFQIILLAVFGALAVAGVLIFALATAVDQGDALGPVEIWGSLPERTITPVLQLAAETDPRLAQVTYLEKDPVQYEAELTNALATGGGPDLFILRQDYAMKNAPKIAPIPSAQLSRKQFADTFVEAAAPFYSSEGALAVPLVVDPLVLYWNRDTLSGNGYAKPPLYWSEVADMAASSTIRRGDGSIEKATVALGEFSNIPAAKWILSALVMQAGGTPTTVDSEGRLEASLGGYSGGGREAAESAISFYTEFANPSKETYSWSRSLGSAQRAFSAGDLALYVGHASEAALIQQMNPNLNFAIARLPQRSPSARPVNVATVYALAVSRTSKNPVGARTVASLIAQENLSRELAIRLGVSSALRDVLAKLAEGEQDLFNRETLIARSWIDPDPEKTSNIFRAMIERIAGGETDVTEAILRADQEIGQLVNN